MSYESWRYRAEQGEDPFALADEAAAAAPTRARWACARGCAHCCWLRVEVTPLEADRLAGAVTPDLADRVRARAEAARGLAPAAHRLPCAFLADDGTCLAYDARPLRCRAHVSADEPTCRAVRKGVEGSTAVPGDPWLATVVTAIQAGLPGGASELHAAVATRLRP